MSEIWEEIISDYDKAKQYLWGSKKASSRCRDEEQGRYYMWKAFHAACEAEPKDHLTFARILMMMASESRMETFDYDRYHKYVEPALAAYERAIEAGQHPSEKELSNIRFAADSMSYILECEAKPYDEQIRHIKGYEKLNDFGFHDSKPIWFEHTEDCARLKLKYGDLAVTLLFEGISDVHVHGEPTTNWIEDIYCYPCFRSELCYTFDVGYYKIICTSISVELIEREESR